MISPWIDIARKEMGVHEIPGPEANPRIVAYHQTTTLRATSDEVPWCSSFVNWCLKQAGIQGTNSAAAASWLKWGSPCSRDAGAVVVLRHKVAGQDAATGSSSGFHVGFLLAIDAGHVRVLGGNQGDMVKESLFPLANYEVMDCRCPPLPA